MKHKLYIIFLLLIGIPSILWSLAILNRDNIKEPPNRHVWGAWSKPEITSDWYHGTDLWQIRTCNDCGEAEMRKVQVSADGSYKK